MGLLGLEADRVKLVSDRQVLESILLGVNRDRVTDADLQALAYAPGMADNPMVQGHYTTYLSNKADRKFLTAGEFGEAETSPSVRRLDLLAESTKQELIKAAESVIGIMEMRIVAVQDYYVGQAQGRIGELPAEAAREAELTRRVLASQQVVEELSGELLRAGIAEVVEVGYVDIVDLAQVSNSPLRPGGPPKVMLGLLLGLAFGVAGAFGVHRVDTTVKDREDAEATLGISSLAVIPRTDTDKRLTHRVFGGLLNGRKPARSQVLLPAEGLAATPVAEAFRSLRTNLIFSQATSDLKSIVITSPMPGEGKTTTSGYLGAVFARQGARTLLIDSDLRKPRLHILFKSERSPGLTDVLLGEVELQAGVRKTEIDNLYLLPAGRGTSNPSELLGSKRLLRLAEAMRKEFDLVIWDSPPVLAFTDAAILGRAADGVILVLFAGTTERRAAQAASAQLRQSGAHMLGAVVNGFDPGGGIQYEYAYGYYSSYYYASQFTEGDS